MTYKRFFRFHVGAATLLTAVGGCHTQIPFDQGLEAVNKAVKDANPVRLSDYDSDVTNGSQLNNVFTPFAQFVASRQCAYRAANPLVPVIAGPISLAVQVSNAEGGTAQLTISATPGLQLGGTYTRTEQTGITAPIALVSAINVPDFYLGQVLPYFANLGGLPSAPTGGGTLTEGQKKVQTILLHELQTRDALRTVVTKQIGDYQAAPAKPGGVDGYCKTIPTITAQIIAPTTFF
jgi:hypothetical protein